MNNFKCNLTSSEPFRNELQNSELNLIKKYIFSLYFKLNSKCNTDTLSSHGLQPSVPVVVAMHRGVGRGTLWEGHTNSFPMGHPQATVHNIQFQLCRLKFHFAFFKLKNQHSVNI